MRAQHRYLVISRHRRHKETSPGPRQNGADEMPRAFTDTWALAGICMQALVAGEQNGEEARVQRKGCCNKGWAMAQLFPIRRLSFWIVLLLVLFLFC